MAVEQARPRIKRSFYDGLLKDVIGQKARRPMFFTDVHFPFNRKCALDEMLRFRDKYDCNEFYCGGDLFDHHFMSFHDSDPDGFGCEAEFEQAIKEFEKWKKEFPIVRVATGNHDAIPDRKRFKAGMSKRWVRTIDEVYDCEGWTFEEDIEIFPSVILSHGVGMDAYTRTRREEKSYIQGHRHTSRYLRHCYEHDQKNLFAVQLGSMIDRKAYAFAYAKGQYIAPSSLLVLLGDGDQNIIPIMESF